MEHYMWNIMSLNTTNGESDLRKSQVEIDFLGLLGSLKVLLNVLCMALVNSENMEHSHGGTFSSLSKYLTFSKSS